MDLFDMNKQFANTGDELPRSTGKLPADEAEHIEEQKKLRRLVKLPVTKALVYYKHPYHIGDSPFSVISFNAEKFKRNGKEYDWYMVTIQVMGIEDTIRIHGDNFAEMQKPNFIEQSFEFDEDDGSEEQ